MKTTQPLKTWLDALSKARTRQDWLLHHSCVPRHTKYDYANTCHYIEEFKRIKVTKPQGESW